MSSADEKSLDILFRNARTYTAWQDKEVDDALLQRVYDLAKMGPTSANCCPLRIVFVKLREAKERLRTCLDTGNVEKTMTAPVTAILGYDLEFYTKMDRLWPRGGGKAFEGKEEIAKIVAFRNGSLQAAYFLLAARALGLDCGPMSGFDNGKVDERFFPDSRIKSNFLCNLGYGDASKLFPRGPRLEFQEVCKVI